jgi:exonuclease SbcC
MITRIELTNFMSHEHTVIEPAPGLTVLIGPNNCGKSAIVAALQILSSNENSTYVMRHGAKDCAVRVETDDGHLIEWGRKKSPSYVIDGTKFEKLKNGVPDELHAALRLPKVEAGDNNDFDIHFGTQKSPIFLLGGSSANAARFFASSSDAIRLVEMQKRHKDKLADAQREKNRLEAESRKVNAALETLEPVIEIDKRLAAARKVYAELQQLAERIEAAENAESGLRSQSATVEKYNSQFEALCNLTEPPALVPPEPLAKLMEAKVAAERRLRSAESRAEALRSLPSPPSVPPTGPFEDLIRAMETEQLRMKTIESQSHALSVLQPPPEQHDDSALDQLVADIVRSLRNYARSNEQSRALAPVCPPPQLSDFEPLRQHFERLAEYGADLAARRSKSEILDGLREPPLLADESGLAELLGSLQVATRRLAQMEAKSVTIADIAPAPTIADTSGLSELLSRIEEGEKRFGTCAAAQRTAVICLDDAAAAVRSTVEGRACPICGSALDAENLLVRATVGLGGHDHA